MMLETYQMQMQKVHSRIKVGALGRELGLSAGACRRVCACWQMHTLRK